MTDPPFRSFFALRFLLSPRLFVCSFPTDFILMGKHSQWNCAPEDMHGYLEKTLESHVYGSSEDDPFSSVFPLHSENVREIHGGDTVKKGPSVVEQLIDLDGKGNDARMCLLIMIMICMLNNEDWEGNEDPFLSPLMKYFADKVFDGLGLGPMVVFMLCGLSDDPVSVVLFRHFLVRPFFFFPVHSFADVFVWVCRFLCSLERQASRGGT